jgi:hypothetical protein
MLSELIEMKIFGYSTHNSHSLGKLLEITTLPHNLSIEHNKSSLIRLLG